MAIRVERNEQGNCVNFHGSSNPTYWNACLTAYVDDDVTDSINIVNDIITAQTGVTEYEYFQIPFTDFTRADNSDFATAQEAADYISQAARVIGVSADSSGNDLNGITVCFKLDDTSTSIVLDNGYSFGVNTIKAVSDGGNISIKSISGDRTLFSNLQVGNACVNDLAVSGGLNDVVNTLNELFTVGAFESVVISDPFSTMIADVGGVAAGHTLEGVNAIDPTGDDIFTNSSSGNFAGLKSTATINQAGEYFTFDIRGEGQIGFGLVHTQDSYDAGYFSGNTNYANPSTFATSNSAHYGFQFSHWFHPTPNGSWTNYGANTSVSYGTHWYSWDKQQDWLDGNPVKVKVGIDVNGFISIETINDDGTYSPHARTTYPVPQGSEFHLGIKTANSSARVYSAPMVHLLEEEAPTMYFRYIESPDGNFEYPLFATAEEANYYDEQNGGTGTSHTHTYDDDPTNTTWYMPTSNSTMTGTSAPTTDTTLGQSATYTEITSLTNSDLTPSQFSILDISQEEGTAVNIQVTPQGASWSTSVSITPSGSGLVYDGYSLIQGTLADVGADTIYTVTVTRANSYGSSVGTFDIQATDVAPVQTNLTTWGKDVDFSGSSEHLKANNNSRSVNPLKMNDQAVLVPVHSTDSTKTSDNNNSRPWATAIVFNIDNVNVEQVMWNQGQPAAQGDNNIYLRVNSSRQLIFGWGKETTGYNECMIHPLPSSPNGYLGHQAWYGVYIAHKGQRFNATNATAANLADAFDIRIMNNAGNNWTMGSNLSVAAAWTSTGYRMDRSITGDFTIGGRGTDRSFYGQVASMVVTTLRTDDDMPTNAEIQEMIMDPMGWIDTYKAGGTFRHCTTDYSDYPWDTNGSNYFATQVWLMGDGTNDSYSNGIRNQVNNTDGYTKLVFQNMISNDIQTVNINGLT